MALLRNVKYANNFIRRKPCMFNFHGRIVVSFSSAASKHVSSNAQFCVDLVKESDYDNYLCGLLLPRDKRRSFFAVRAFNCEVAHIKDIVHGNAMTGAIRFQWWTDQIERIYAGQTNSADHPVVQELVLTVEKHELTKRLFTRCIDARQRDLTVTRPETLSDLEDYAEGAHSSIIYLLLQILGVNSTQADYTASHIGVCSGLTTLLRGTAFHASQGHIYIPRETAGNVNLTEKVIMKGPQDDAEVEALRGAVYDIAAQAHGHLARARALMKGESVGKEFDTTNHFHDGSHSLVPEDAIYALLPVVRASMFLDDLQSVAFNPFDQKIIGKNPALKYQIQLIKTIWFKRF
jgi:NADH dehydrogenase [ubiquinone] 1 alpha subcomplex assembly factor 6